MKKVICAMLCLLMLLALSIPAAAANAVVIFTKGSEPMSGSSMKVDLKAMADQSSATSEMWHAVYTGDTRAECVWYRDGVAYGYEESISFDKDDVGCQIYVVVFYYVGDQELLRLRSDTYTVSSKVAAPKITITSLPEARVGEEYYTKVECTDLDAEYSLYQSPDFEASGLTLTKNGVIQGVPKKAGLFHLNVMASNAGGEDVASFDLLVNEEEQYSLEIVEVPKKLVYYAGETLNLKGLKVRVYTSDGFFDSYDGDKLTITKKPLTTVGEQKIKVAYKNAMDIFIVTVKPAPATEATTEPTAVPTTVPPTTAPATEPTQPATQTTVPAQTEPVEVIATEPGITEPPDSGLTIGAMPEPGGSGMGTPLGLGLILVVAGGICLAVLAVVAVVMIVVIVIVKKKKGSK